MQNILIGYLSDNLKTHGATQCTHFTAHTTTKSASSEKLMLHAHKQSDTDHLPKPYIFCTVILDLYC